MEADLYEEGIEFSAMSDIIIVAPSTTVKLINRESAKVGRIHIDSLRLFVQPGSEDLIYFSLHRDNHPIAPFDNVNGGFVTIAPIVAVNDIFPPGIFEIRARNVSGVNIKCQAGWTGRILVQKNTFQARKFI